MDKNIRVGSLKSSWPVPAGLSTSTSRRRQNLGEECVNNEIGVPNLNAPTTLNNGVVDITDENPGKNNPDVRNFPDLKSKGNLPVQTKGKRKLTSKKDQLPISLNETKLPSANEGYVSAESLAAVAIFKGIIFSSLATAIGIPLATLEAYFSGSPISMRLATKQLLANNLGVDLQNGRMRDGQVHIFKFDNMGYFSSQATFKNHMVALGFLLKDSFAVSIGLPLLNSAKRLTMPTLHVVQNNHVRALFVSSRRGFYNAVFRPELISGCNWALKNEKASVANVYQEATTNLLINLDITPVDFDEIFLGRKALSWSDVETMARINQVSKKALVDWIQTVGISRSGTILEKSMHMLERNRSGSPEEIGQSSSDVTKLASGSSQ